MAINEKEKKYVSELSEEFWLLGVRSCYVLHCVIGPLCPSSIFSNIFSSFPS